MTQTAIDYAIVLYELEIDKNIIFETKDIFDSVHGLEKIFCDPIIAKENKYAIIDKIFNKSIRNFLKVVVNNQCMDIIKDIFEAYKNYYYKKNKIVAAKLSYMTMPTDEETKGIESFLKDRFNADTVEIMFEKTQDLIGGFVISVDNIEFDYSIKGRIKQLQQKLIWR